MIEPIHIATIGEHQLRFFRRPINDGKSDFPWLSIDDLHCCFGLDQELRKAVLSKLHKWGGLKTVATAAGIIVIEPLYMAQGIVDAMVEQGHAPASLRSAYYLASTEAIKKLTVHLAIGTDGWISWMKAVRNCHDGEGLVDDPPDYDNDISSDHRCDGCLRSWDDVRGGPMLHHDRWARICGDRPGDVLCEPCIQERFERVYHRQLRIDDLYPCPINVMCGHYQELAPPPPRLLVDWARYVVDHYAPHGENQAS